MIFGFDFQRDEVSFSFLLSHPTALSCILGIDPAQVMAFGDNYNDETMLDVVGVPYIMDNAAAPLRAKYQNHTPRPEDVLAQLLAQQL